MALPRTQPLRPKRSQAMLSPLLALSLALGSQLAFSREARAIDRDVKAVIVAGEYGLVGGTVLGLAALPFARDARAIFIGSSLGLYLGIAVGFYYITHRDDPGNPLRLDDRKPRYDEGAIQPSAEPKWPGEERKVQLVSVPILSF